MPENSIPNRSSQPPEDGDFSGINSEQELDAILAQAGGLAQDLREQIGPPTKINPGAASDPAISLPDPGNRTLDADLDELEQLVTSAAGELGAFQTDTTSPLSDRPNPAPPNRSSAIPPPGSTPSLSASPTTPTPRPPPHSAHANNVPDFMREFMDQEEGAARPDSAPSTPKPPSMPGQFEKPPHAHSGQTATSPGLHPPKLPPLTKPGVVGTGMLGVVTAPAIDHPLMASPPQPPSHEVADVPMSTSAQRLRARLSRMALPLFGIGVSVLERIDRPFSGLRPGIRRAIGWFSLATLAIATLVYIIAIF